jgi:magnesium-transporting ATPase (P-type)
MENRTETNIHQLVKNWKAEFQAKSEISKDNIEELESHLLDEIEALTQKELTETEAFLVAKHSIGDREEVLKEYRKVNKWSYFLHNIKPFILGALLYAVLKSLISNFIIYSNLVAIEFNYYDVNLVSIVSSILIFSLVLIAFMHYKKFKLKATIFILLILNVVGYLPRFNIQTIVGEYGSNTYGLIIYNSGIASFVFSCVFGLICILVLFSKTKKERGFKPI